jgi:uncharacterized protein YbjQ (UPF0145 family)
MNVLFQIGIPLGLLLLGWLAGRAAEAAHLRKLTIRETELSSILVTNIKSFPGGMDPASVPTLVRGEVVIASDYLKTFLARLKKLLGGRLGTYETLMNRAVREALVRMQEDAKQLGYDAICNVRLDSADIGGGAMSSKARPMAVLFVNGTAYRRLRGDQSGQTVSG